MKSWILSHKMLAIILACVLGAGVICAVVLPITLAHRHEFSAEWTTDENYHWHKCKGEKCNEVSDKASHVFDEEIVSKMYFASDATYTAAAKYYKSCICGVKGTETFSHGSPLSAKANTIAFADGLTLDKSYDGTAVVFDASQVNRYGDGAITIMYKVKGADDNTYIATAPKNVGEYTVKVSVEGTAEWKAASKTVDFAIAKKALKATATKTYDGTDTMPATLTDVLDGETVTATITMTSKNVGATVKEVMLAGADKDNYILTVANVTASITAKTLKATATKTYDGTDTMPATLTDVLDGETVTATITMTSKNVGATVKEVMLAGADKDNYMLTVANVTASITAKTLTVTATKTYDGTANMPATLTGVVAGETVTVTITMTSKNVGATVKEVMLAGADKGNYMLTVANVTASITAKTLTVTATKTYDGTANMPATLTGVVAGETVTVTITMTSKNVGATVKEVMLAGADKGNYTLTAANVTASITPRTISVDWEHDYDNTSSFKGEPAELLKGDEVTITVTMSSANVGSTVQSFKLTGKDAANYSLARKDVNVEIVKAKIKGFEISNANAFTKIFIGAKDIPEPTTNYVEIGTGYGEKTIVWRKQIEDGVWSRVLTKEEVIQSKTGTFQVSIQYAEGDNYKLGATPSVIFTMKAKSRTLTVKSFSGKTYDGTPLSNFTFSNLVNKFGGSLIDGVENFTSAIDSGEKYVEFRRNGEVLWTKVTGTYIPKNAAQYDYRIGVTATEEWEAVVSEIKTFTIKPYEFVLELGYIENQNNKSLDGGKTFKLRTFSQANGKELIKGQVIELWLNNEKAGLKTNSGNNFIPDQKKQVKTDCFFLKITNFASPNMENYKIVAKYPTVTTVEMTVVEKLTEKSTTGPIQALNETGKWIRATVVKGYFKVGQTVEVYNSAGTKLGEATITEIKVKGTSSASGCAIPSDGLVVITLDKVFSDMVYGKLVEK